MLKFLRLPEVRSRTGLGRSTIYQLIEKGEFPKQIQLSWRSVGWLEHEIEEWIECKIANLSQVKQEDKNAN
ncbi:MAG: helix-turn-helix transcriptional regulator [Oligoflexales bacterium]